MKKQVTVSANILSSPRICCCCSAQSPTSEYNAASTRTSGKRVVKTQTKTWSFPLCISCENWIASEIQARRLGTGFILLIIVFICCLYTKAFEFSVVAFLGATLTFFLWKNQKKAATSIKPNPSCTVVPIRYNGWHGSVHNFEFSNSVFFAEFEKLNNKKLIA